MEGYWCYWHGAKGYSGVGLHVSKALSPSGRPSRIPSFDYENRIVTAELAGFTVASVYVPNGGKDFDAKMRFLDALDAFAAESRAAGNAAGRSAATSTSPAPTCDVHPKERKPRASDSGPRSARCSSG